MSLGAIILWCVRSALAQAPLPRLPAAPPPAPRAGSVPGAATAPRQRQAAKTADTSDDDEDDEISPRELLRRLKKLEAENRRLEQKNRELEERYEDLSKKVNEQDDDDRKSRDEATEEKKKAEEQAKLDLLPGSRTGDVESGGDGRFDDSPWDQDSQIKGNKHLGKLKLNAAYNYDREGFQFTTENSEIELKIRGLLQADSRIYQPAKEDPVSSGFYIPRMRLYFTGRVTKPIEYNLAIQRTYNDFNLLNAYVNVHYDDRFQLRFGRFKTPYTYEFYEMHVWQLLAPERSLYNVNFALNRQIGLMGWGQLFEERMEYAVGMFNGPRRSFQNFNHTPDVVGFLNFKPFQSGNSFLKNLNIGGSGTWGQQDNPAVPAVLRTSVNASDVPLDSNAPVNSAVVPFLAFNNGVREKGPRALWDLHLAYFYRGLSLLGAWEAGYDDFSRTHSSNPVHLPVGGYYVQMGYLLTGETITERTVIEPIHPFDITRGRFGLGAFEPTARFSSVQLGKQVFTGGLADPNLWSNSAYMVDVGLNWYLNKFTKIYFDWEHSVFGQPVYYAPGLRQKANDLFWLRFQLYF